jgi:transcriptional regulator with XRE-family HTH domain
VSTIKSPSPVDKHVGNRMRMRRMMVGMSQTDLGQAFGVSFQQVQKYEKGINRMGSSRLQQAADILEVAVPFFFEGMSGTEARAHGIQSPDYIDEFVSSYDGIRLIKSLHAARQRWAAPGHSQSR